MKYILIFSFFISSVVSASSNIEPFGKFRWGDGYVEAIKKLCSYDFDEFTRPFKVSKESVCNLDEINYDKLDEIARESNHQSILFRIKTFEFEGVDITDSRYTNTAINANGINILGVKHSIELNFGDNDNDRLKGAFLAYRDKITKININDQVIFSPLLLKRVVFKAMNKQEGHTLRPKLFNLLKDKYQKSGELSEFPDSEMLSVEGEDGTSLRFSYELVYDSGKILMNQSLKALSEYNESTAKENQNNDISSEL